MPMDAWVGTTNSKLRRFRAPTIVFRREQQTVFCRLGGQCRDGHDSDKFGMVPGKILTPLTMDIDQGTVATEQLPFVRSLAKMPEESENMDSYWKYQQCDSYGVFGDWSV